MDVTTLDASEITTRQLLAPSEQELQQVLYVLRVAFKDAAVQRMVLDGDLAPARVDALHLCFVRAALVRGEGEVWIAEGSDATGRREIVGVAIWFLPGAEFLSSERQRKAAKWEEMAAVLGKEQARWFEEYFLPRMAALWKRSCRPGGETPKSGYFLSKLAVLPGCQYGGIATALGLPILARVLDEDQSIFGQATTESDARGYERVGGKILGVETFWPRSPEGRGRGPVRIWAMAGNTKAIEGTAYWTSGTGARVGDMVRAKL